MRFKIMRQGGYASAGLSSAGGTLTGPLILSGDPLQTMEAVNKSYVDGILSNINAANLTTGTLSVGRMPAFTGDITNTQGTANFTLKASGVSPGSYPKVTVDTKGLVTNGYTLTAADMPPVSWNKVTSGKPTTLAGYGITDAVPPGGGAVVGSLSVTSSPTDPLHVVNKSYVDSLSAPTVPNVTGDIVRRFDPVTPVGYLRCNGGLVSKTAYPALYAIFGDNAVNPYSNMPGAGQPWCQQYEFNTTQSANLGGWTAGPNIPVGVDRTTLIVTKNRVYLLGGLTTGYNNINNIYTAVIAADGSVGNWTSAGNLPSAISDAEVIVVKNKVHLISYYGSYVSTINADGTIGGWSTGSVHPGNLLGTRAIVIKNYVYTLGGNSGGTNVVSTIYRATINSDGSLSGFSAVGNLPAVIQQHRIAVTKNRVYILGGHNGSNHVFDIYTAPINADGTLGSWASGGSLSNGDTGSVVAVTRNKVYLIGKNGSSVTACPINVDGTLGAWASGGANLASAVYPGQVFATNSRLYIVGGYVPGVDYYNGTQYTSFQGGANDYSTFYTTGYSATDPDNFQLPDYTGRELDGSYTYIKT